MTSPRSLANQQLYYARILASSWRLQLERETIPATVLAGSFELPARRHLALAYGWFLLEIVQSDAMPDVPPLSCDQLPEIVEGKVLPGEIRELQQLEVDGWLAEMINPASEHRPATKTAGNLAMPVGHITGPDQIDSSIDQLQALFERMADSLDEY